MHYIALVHTRVTLAVQLLRALTRECLRAYEYDVLSALLISYFELALTCIDIYLNITL